MNLCSSSHLGMILFFWKIEKNKNNNFTFIVFMIIFCYIALCSALTPNLRNISKGFEVKADKKIHIKAYGTLAVS